MIEFMKKLAIDAGELSLKEFHRLKAGAVEYKSTPRDIVTVADRAVEQFIFEAMAKNYPEYDFYGEETGKKLSDKDYCWVIDPIDGTACFAAGLPTYCISIALQFKGETIRAAIYAPRLKELFWAEKGKGAFLNGERLWVGDCSRLSDAMLVTGFSCLRAGLKENNLKYFARLAPEARGILRLGSAALDLCYVAAGRFDAYWELLLQPYDYAGGILLVTEAGGLVHDLAGGNDLGRKGIVAASPGIEPAMMQYLSD